LLSIPLDTSEVIKMREICITRTFAAAHSLEGYPGDCARLHGHNWKVEAVVVSDTLDSLGMIMDFRDLKASLDKILSQLDHRMINETDLLKGGNPTAERISEAIFEALSPLVQSDQQNRRLFLVKVWENESSWAAFSRK
jgi:6-pyruvoyltetrahydropterin/6-carboxytetrahydropterin synthase